MAYASRILALAKLNYAQIEWDTLDIVFAVRNFYQYLYGQQVYSNDRPPPTLQVAGQQPRRPSLAAQIQRWALIPSAYQYVLEYTPGSQNECADCLSRLQLPSD